MRDKDIRTTYEKIQYNLYRRSFEVASRSFRLKCYNRPEFMIEPVTISIDEFSKVFDR